MQRALLITTMLMASLPAVAEPVATPLQISLVVVEGCARLPGSNAPCPAPAQPSGAAALPAQVRELAPAAEDESGSALPEPPTVYY